MSMTVCVHVHVWWEVQVTNDFCVTQYSRHCLHAYEGTVYAVGHSLFLSTLFPLLAFVDPRNPWFPFHLKGSFSSSFAQIPNVGGTLGLSSDHSCALYLYVSLDELIPSHGFKCH